MNTSPLTVVNFLAVGLGAMLGAWGRWGLSLWLNTDSTRFPLGTFAANLVGSYVIGMAVAYSLFHPNWPPHVRLFLVTGMLGGLTTFSSFSAETVTFFQEGRWFLGLSYAGVSLLGALCMTALGWWTFTAFKGG